MDPGTIFTQADWPNPRYPQKLLPGTSHVRGYTDVTIFRTPLVYRVPVQPLRGQVDPIPNTLLLVLTQVAQNPFTSRTDVASFKPASTFQHGFQEAPPLTLRSSPFIPQVFPNPTVRSVAQPDFQGFPLALVIQTLPSPFKQLDWPNPVLPKPPLLKEHTWRDHPLLVAIPVPDPFKPVEFPNPTLRLYRQQPDLLPNNLPFQFVVTAFRQNDWPNPILRVYRQQPEYIPNHLPIRYTIFNFRQTEWPNPLRARPVLQTDIPQRSQVLDVIVEVLPFSLRDWPVPLAPRSGVTHDSYGVPISFIPETDAGLWYLQWLDNGKSVLKTVDQGTSILVQSLRLILREGYHE